MNADLLTRESALQLEASYQILVCRAGGVLTCLCLSHIARTISLVSIQAMPGAADHVVGLMNFSGSSIPVIDLAIRLGLPSLPYTLDTPILVCMHEDRRIGVIVQDIVGIRTLHSQDEQLSAEFGRHGSAFRASAHTDLGLVLMLDVSWLTQTELYRSDVK